MPKDLFHTLKRDKQERIIKAALSEFSSCVFNEASINQIVKSAEIPRGSFYQYFVDKEDLYLYILESIIDENTIVYIQNYFKGSIIDIYQVYRVLLSFNLNMLSSEKYKNFFKNLYLSLDYNIQSRVKLIFERKRNEIILQKLKNQDLKIFMDSKYTLELIKILELINRDLMTTKIAEELSDEEILSIFDLRISIIKGNKQND